ncbi:MAG TPA: DUF2971 domain-containing protein [Leeuwenhoekiella sp.]|nr:DUF2971 domain-containing protein [Leeuwenhoekiella sp.]
MAIIDVPEVFKTQDMIYHYCSLNTAIDYILKIDKNNIEKNNPELRLSTRGDSNDPIERIIPKISTAIAAISEGDLKRITDLTVEKTARLERSLKSQFEKARQVCFCKNRDKIETIDDYGFLKPRMWDQYANRYHGVCLAFSKRELLKIEKINLKDDLKYKIYQELEQYNPQIDCNDVLDDYEKAYQILEKDANEWLFWKHKDYEGENEYRIYTFAESKYDYINIENCLKGIIYPQEKHCKYFHKLLKEYVKNTDIKLFDITWGYNGLTVEKNSTIEGFIRPDYPVCKPSS